METGTSASNFANIDTYIAQFPADVQALLQQMRQGVGAVSAG